MLDRVLTLAVLGLDLVLIALTALPLVPTTQRWIRVWDFPRLQIAVLLVAALAATAWVVPLDRLASIVLLAGLAASLAWQIARIWPYTILHPRQVEDASDRDPERRVQLLVSNVLMRNRQSERLLDHIVQLQPDIVLLVETNAWWANALRPLYEDYPFGIRHPQENTYGMMLFSRLQLVDPQVRYLFDDAVPSIKTGVRLSSGPLITFYGLHPKPPPLADTSKRDAELIIVAKEIRQEQHTAIVAGDLNDVAWSRTTDLFQKISGLLDPRVGRGFYQTFHARHWFARWPLDHIFFDSTFRLHRLSVLSSIGSDHFPLYVALCHQPELRDAQPKPRADTDDLQEAHEVIQDGRKASRHEA